MKQANISLKKKEEINKVIKVIKKSKIYKL